MGTVYGVHHCYDGPDITLLKRNGDMAKKRGGLAGVWDRNKGVIKKVAPIAAGFIPGVGPAVGAALGAAMGGLDRPGKGGIGLDVGGAVRGGLEGYGGAKLGQAAKGGLAKMFTASPLDKLTGAPQVGLTAGGPTSYGAAGSFQPAMAGAGASAPAAAYTGNIGGYGIGMPLGSAAPVPSSAMADLPKMDMSKMIRTTPTSRAPMPDIGMPQATTDGMFKGALTPKTPRSLGSMASDAFGKDGYLERNERMLGGIAKGVGSVLGGRAEAGALESQTELARQKFEYEKQQDETEQERRRRIAELLMPMFTQMQSRQSYGG